MGLVGFGGGGEVECFELHFPRAFDALGMADDVATGVAHDLQDGAKGGWIRKV